MAVIVEKHAAIVTSVDDPEQRGRIKVACAGLMGDEESDLPDWVEPTMDWGWFYVPDVGEQVEIEAAVSSDLDEVPGQTFLDAPDFRWRNKRYYSDEADAPVEARPVHADFKTNYGKRRGFATPNGHVLYFDDTEGKEQIQITWKQGDSFQFFTFDPEGSTIISNKNGTLIYMDAKNGALVISDQHGNSYSSDDKGIKLIDMFSNIIELKDGTIQAISQDAVVITGASLNVKTGSVDLIDGADAHIVRGEDLKLWLETHIHGTGMGPSGPPTIPLPPTALSTAAKVK